MEILESSSDTHLFFLLKKAQFYGPFRKFGRGRPRT
jgi:hypothetical protein